MTQEDARKAVSERWCVRDDFGAIGTVMGDAPPSHVMVKWDADKEPFKVHRERVTREVAPS